MFRLLSRCALFGTLTLAIGATASAQVVAGPSGVNVQGLLLTPGGSRVPDGTHKVTVSLWDAATGGNQKFSETLAGVQTTGGLFSTQLTTLTPALANAGLWIQMQVDTDPAMTPHVPLTSVASALKANTVPDAAIASTQLALDANSLGKVTGGAATAKSGNVGIGTSNPGQKLEVANGALRISSNPGAASQRLYDLNYQPATTSPAAPGYFFVDAYGAARRLAIQDDTGNIGIGTTAPTERLTLSGRLAFRQPAGDQADAGKLDYRSFDSSSLSIVGAGTSNTNRNVRIYDTLSVGYGAPSGASAAFSGKVGIGIAAPTGFLHVDSAASGSNNVPTAVFGGNAPSGTWVDVSNYSAGGNQWELLSTGSGNGEGAGNLVFFDQGALTPRMILTNAGSVGIGTTTPSSELDVNGEVTAKIVTVTGGSDVAEPYDVAPAGDVMPVPGMVVSIEKGGVGRMQVSGRAYDKRVAGIISGANGVAPGITLRHKGTVADGALPVASIGRVWCWCDATAGGPIEEGDLLTTSNTPGHAMKATDHARADGSVIGKAMSSLPSGKGLVLVLVSLK